MLGGGTEVAQNCTILCPTDEPERIVEVVRELIGSRGQVTVDGEDKDWSSITVQDDGASLTLNRLVFEAPGDKFSRMQRGMWAYFDEVETSHTSLKSDLQERIDGLALGIGVVAEPSFVEDSGHFECIFGLADALGAVIWNGSGIIDARGNLILDGAGETETEE
jgi:hypothetical protein